MDPDFLREILVLSGFVALYLFGSMFLQRGHTTDLSAVAQGGPTVAGEGGTVSPRLNRRRKAIAREAAQRGDRDGPDVTE